MKNYIVLDVASAPLPDAETYLEGTVRAPANYKQQAAIDAYVAEKTAERLLMAATDIDLARITAVGVVNDGGERLTLCRDEAAEHEALTSLACLIDRTPTITFGGFNFDLPLIQRRARYLGVPFPLLNLDRYKSPHIDLCELLSDRNPQRRRSLQFYAKRLGWTDLVKTLSGAEEAQVPVSGKWDELESSLRHDVTATHRLAQWVGVLA
jgi:hypothetical protein